MNLFASLAEWETIPLPDAEISMYHSFIGKEESHLLQESLIRETPWQQDVIRIAGRNIPVPRLQAWYGDKHSFYAYSGINLRPLPWTPLIEDLRQRIQKATSHSFNSVLLNYYRDGEDSVSWHADDEAELGLDPVIASLSLGAERNFRMRHKTGLVRNHSCALTDGSLLLMGQGTQKHYVHQIPKEKLVTAPRINLTFRLISDPPGRRQE